MTNAVRWTLDELCAEAARSLEKQESEPLDGRVRDVPDRRTVRYYTTLGLIDRPAEMRGRTAYYGTKHLAQLVAIKRLQAKGHSLNRIQQALLGLNDSELYRLAGLPETPGAKRERGRRDDFWRETPAPSVETPPEPALQGVRLEPGVLLLVEALREIGEEDRAALRQAASALVDILRTRGLIEEIQ